MKKIFTLLFLLMVCVSFVYAQPRAKIDPQNVTPYELAHSTIFAPDSCVTTGMRVVARGTWVYVQCQNFGDATPISNATWSITTKPTGSGSTITPVTGLSWWAKFKVDSTGTYVIHVTMVAGTTTKDTSATFTASTFVGTGNFDGVPAQFPNCMTCHAGMPTFLEVFNRWKVGRHGQTFKFYIDSGSTGFGLSCFKCHTTGYNKNQVINNNGFDDVAARLGWVWSNYSPPKPHNWDTLKTRFPGLVPFAGVECEACHGPGSEHVAGGGDTTKIQKDYDAGVCGSCHDSPDHHPYYTEWKNSGINGHANAIWSSSFAQTNNGSNDLNNCIRCHDAKGYVNFTKGIGTNTNGITQAWQDKIGCQTCHDPHGNDNPYYLRNRPTNSDTLATGQHYSLGEGQTCLDCHKARRNNVTYVQTRVTSSTWGPHHSTQGDVLLGKNAATFNGVPYISGSHASVVGNACVGCHMNSVDTSLVVHLNMGGHSWKMSADSNGTHFDNTGKCQGCHPGNSQFSDFMAPADYDGNNLVEDWQTEIKGCIHNLGVALPHTGVDSVSWSLIAADSNNVTLRKAFWNYQLIVNDASFGIHNPFFAVNVLLASRGAIIGIDYQWTEVPKTFELTQNYPNPFNPTTKFTFSLPKSQQVTIKVYDIMGREVKTLVDSKVSVGKYTVSWDGTNNMGQQIASGVYFYRLVTNGYVDVKKMVLVK